MMPNITLLLIFVFWISLVHGQQHLISQTNIMDLLRQLPETSKLSSILNPNVQTYLTKQQNTTFFAPNNDAFNDSRVEFNGWYHSLPVYHLDWNITSIELTRHNKSLVKLSFEKQQRIVESGMMLCANVLQSIPIDHQNSVVHIIDRILLPPTDIIKTLTTMGFTKAKSMFESYQIPLNSQLTLFVPNNQAFGTVDPTTLGDSLLLQAHISEGLITSNLWTSNMSIKSLNGFNMTLSEKTKNDWQVLESLQFPAKILSKDILFENGVMHVINQVLWANNWDRATKLSSNASQTKLNQPIICLIALIILLS